LPETEPDPVGVRKVENFLDYSFGERFVLLHHGSRNRCGKKFRNLGDGPPENVTRRIGVYK
jgi:hypothetical protein